MLERVASVGWEASRRTVDEYSGVLEQRNNGEARKKEAERYQAAIVAKSRVTRFERLIPGGDTDWTQHYRAADLCLPSARAGGERTGTIGRRGQSKGLCCRSCGLRLLLGLLLAAFLLAGLALPRALLVLSGCLGLAFREVGVELGFRALQYPLFAESDNDRHSSAERQSRVLQKCLVVLLPRRGKWQRTVYPSAQEITARRKAHRRGSQCQTGSEGSRPGQDSAPAS